MPFSPTELTARVRAALRRRAETEHFVLDDLVIHYEQRRVQVAGRPVQLTAAGVGRAGRGRRLRQGPALGEPTTSHGVRGPRGRDLVRARAVSSSSTTSPRGPQITMRSISSSVIASAVRS